MEKVYSVLIVLFVILLFCIWALLDIWDRATNEIKEHEYVEIICGR